MLRFLDWDFGIYGDFITIKVVEDDGTGTTVSQTYGYTDSDTGAKFESTVTWKTGDQNLGSLPVNKNDIDWQEYNTGRVKWYMMGNYYSNGILATDTPEGHSFECQISVFKQKEHENSFYHIHSSSCCDHKLSSEEGNHPEYLAVDHALDGFWEIESMRITGGSVPSADSLYTEWLGELRIDPCENSRSEPCTITRILADGRTFPMTFQVWWVLDVEGPRFSLEATEAPEEKYDWSSPFQIDTLTEHLFQFSCDRCVAAYQWGGIGSGMVVRAVK